MRLYSYKLTDHHVDLNRGANSLRVYFIRDTGKVFKRRLTNPILGTFFYHKGILLGVTAMRSLVFAHNTDVDKGPSIAFEHVFTNDMTMYEDKFYVSGERLKIVERALIQCVKFNRFNAISYNCITFINISYTHGMRLSIRNK